MPAREGAADWSALPTAPLVGPDQAAADLASVERAAQEVAAQLRKSGKSARGVAKKQTWPELSEQDVTWAASLVHRVATGQMGPGQLEAELAEVAEVEQ